jgi:hypothetical protein
MSETIAPPREAIAAAAAWWASRLGDCHHDAVGLNAPNVRLTVEDMETAISENITTMRGKYSAEEQELFRIALEDAIAAHLRGEEPATSGTRRSAVRYSNHEDVVYCDYDPDETLIAAAEAAGIDLDSRDLPRKTTMIFSNSRVIVSEGYAAPFVAIWPEGLTRG